jgi:hypothetical protein
MGDFLLASLLGLRPGKQCYVYTIAPAIQISAIALRAAASNAREEAQFTELLGPLRLDNMLLEWMPVRHVSRADERSPSANLVIYSRLEVERR